MRSGFCMRSGGVQVTNNPENDGCINAVLLV
jgi:ribosomal protein S8E